MAKRTKLSKTVRKVSTLPSIDDEDDFTCNEFLSNSIGKESFISSSTSLSPGEEDEDDELPVGIMKSSKESQKLKTGDLVWIKHSRKFCFWPSYIKAISGNKISAYFIGYNKFLCKEKSFRYSLTSKSVFKYPGNNYKQIVSDSREFLEGKEKNGIFHEINSPNAFNNAIELADAYILYRSNKEFSNRSEELDFFRSNGLSLCLKSNDSSSSSLTRPPTPLEQNSDSEFPFSFSSRSSDTDTLSSSEKTQNSSPGNYSTDQLSPNSSPKAEQDSESVLTTPDCSSSRVRRKRKRTNEFTLFNERNQRLVEYIVAGHCDKRLTKIFNLQVRSQRMQAYFEVWDLNSSLPKRKNLEIQACYYGNETQLEVVSKYLKTFINEKFEKVRGLVKKDELLFNVFLPEATIYSIHKLHRHSLAKAEKIFVKGHSMKGLPIDPLLLTPLNDEERATVERKNRRFAEKFGLFKS